MNQYTINPPIGTIACWKTAEGKRNFIKIIEGTSDNYIPYARYLIENNLKQKLKKGEIVHHINENKLDDNILNLKVMSISDHISFHNKGKIPFKAIKMASLYYKQERDKIFKIVMKLYLNGKSLRKIAKDLGKGRGTITKIIKENQKGGKKK